MWDALCSILFVAARKDSNRSSPCESDQTPTVRSTSKCLHIYQTFGRSCVEITETPKNSLVLLPDPYGNWLNHPFQPLRNDPGFDGRTVYAIDDRPFETMKEFPDRRVYRYVYRGPWAPYAGSPETARLQQIRDVSGSRVHLQTTLGIPDAASSVTARIATNERSVYYVAPNVTDSLDIDLSVSEQGVRVTGGVRPVANDTLAVDGRNVVRLTVFVDSGLGGGFAYRFDLPVDVSKARIRALTPRIERFRNARTCGGAAAYIPASAPDGIFVRTDLHAGEPNA